MIRLLIWLLMAYIGYRVIKALLGSTKQTAPNNSVRDPAATTHRDPVCGMYVSEEDAVIGRHGDGRHYFCSMACLEKYREQLDHTSH